MNDKLQIALATLAEKLDTTVPLLWQALKKQAFIESISNSVFYVVGFFVLRWLSKKIKEEEKDFNVPMPFYFGLGLIFSVIYICVFLLSFSQTLAGFFNPEYAALEILGNAVRGAK